MEEDAPPFDPDLWPEALRGLAEPPPLIVTVLSDIFLAALLLLPALAFVFAALNLRRHPERRVLFLTAMLSSGIATLAFLAQLFAPWALPDVLDEMDILGFTLLFLYIWALLDLWRGGQATAFEPRWLTGLILATGLVLPISIAAIWVLT